MPDLHLDMESPVEKINIVEELKNLGCPFRKKALFEAFVGYVSVCPKNPSDDYMEGLAQFLNIISPFVRGARIAGECFFDGNGIEQRSAT